RPTQHADELFVHLSSMTSVLASSMPLLVSGRAERLRGSLDLRIVRGRDYQLIFGYRDTDAFGSPVDGSSDALDRAVDTSGAEAHAPQNMMENVAVSVALRPCPRLSGVFRGGSIRRPIRPPRGTLRHELTSVCPA